MFRRRFAAPNVAQNRGLIKNPLRVFQTWQTKYKPWRASGINVGVERALSPASQPRRATKTDEAVDPLNCRQKGGEKRGRQEVGACTADPMVGEKL